MAKETLQEIQRRLKVGAAAAMGIQRDQLRAALVGLVGVDGRAELEQLETVMRLMPAPAADKAVTIDAIHALLSTLESPSPDDAAADPGTPAPRETDSPRRLPSRASAARARAEDSR